jgi:Gas vesicle protein G
MGLLTGLLTLPLAPVRGTIWIAEQLALQAERELGDETSLRRMLAEAERDFELGELTIEEYESIEDALLERLELIRAQARQEGDPHGQ